MKLIISKGENGLFPTLKKFGPPVDLDAEERKVSQQKVLDTFSMPWKQVFQESVIKILQQLENLR